MSGSAADEPSSSGVPAALLARLADPEIFPGDLICAVEDFERVLLGPGIVRVADGTQLAAAKQGVLCWEPARQRLWVENEQRRYVPAVGEHVIGVIVDKHAEEYRLQIGGAHPATLPVLAFDGASKRNRPHLEVGALVFARVVLAHKDMEPEVTCAAPPGVSAKDWVTKESIYGELPGGHVFECPTALCARLNRDDCPVLEALGGHVAFEIAIGANGRVWISSLEPGALVLAQAAILQSQALRDEDHAALVQRLAAQLREFVS